MLITEIKLRKIIRTIIVENVNDNEIVTRLNMLIDMANENEAQWNLSRWDSDNPYAKPPNDDRKHIAELMHSLDWLENPPKNLKCWYVIEAVDGEIIGQSKHLSYDEVLEYAEENGFYPADELGNPNPDGPSKENGGSGLYFIYEDDMPMKERQ